MNLFRKAAVFTDIHIGLKSNSQTHLADCLNYTNWFIETALANGCDICLFLGDFFNNRNSINLVTLNTGIQVLRLLNDAFDRIIMIPGNHDLYYKDNRTIHSIEWAHHIPNVEILNDWHEEGNCIFVPWIVKDEHKKIMSANAKYMFGHFELPNFLMNAAVVMPDVGNLKHSHFNGVDKVFSGHFHKRQVQGNIHYIGNAFPHNFSDAWDDDRGMMILEWGKEPEFITWPEAPKYRTAKLSQLVDEPTTYLPKNGYIKIYVDTDVSYEEANYLKESLIDEYELREISIVPLKNDEYTEDLAPGNFKFKSVNEIVYENIINIQSEFYDPNLLLEIYKNLQ